MFKCACSSYICTVTYIVMHSYCVKFNITDTDPTTVKVNHTLKPDVYTGIYNLTIYISLLTHDPLLPTSILSIRVNHYKSGFEDFTEEDIFTTENMVMINLKISFFLSVYVIHFIYDVYVLPKV